MAQFVVEVAVDGRLVDALAAASARSAADLDRLTFQTVTIKPTIEMATPARLANSPRRFSAIHCNRDIHLSRLLPATNSSPAVIYVPR
jgi:hypothetical protein